MATTPTSRSTTPGDASIARAAGAVWDDLATELADLAALARTANAPEVFYGELLRRAAAALAAEGGAVWAPQADGRARRICVIAAAEPPRDPQQRQWHERLIAETAASGNTRVVAPRSEQPGQHAGNASRFTLVLAPVRSPVQAGDALPAAIVELALRPDCAPSLYRGAENLLRAACEVAGEFQTLHDLRRLHRLCDDQQRLLTLTERVHRRLSLGQAASAIANEARDAIGCDRVSVLATHGARCRLLAISGVDRPDKRSRTVRGLQQIAAISSRLGDPLYVGGDGVQPDEPLPQAAEALARYLDESNARQLAVVPLRAPSSADGEDQHAVGVLVAETFDADARSLARDRVGEVARVCAPALANALEFDATPLAGLSTRLRRLSGYATLMKSLAVAALLAAAAAALLLVPAELRIEARGELQPVERHNVFAPHAGVVEGVLVEHGQRVQQGDLLLELRDPELDLEIKRVEGERQTTLRQLQAVRATRSSLDPRDDRTESYRLSAEEQQLDERLKSLQAERDLLAAQRDALAVRSPADGMVVTWELAETLLGRPVERGQSLLSVADTTGDWRVELKLPDDRIGYLLDAERRRPGEPLPVEFRLGSQESGFLNGELTRIAQRAEPAEQAATGAMRTVVAYVAPDAGAINTADPQVRPGASVRARVLCGPRPLGYVWTHDLVNAARIWWEF